MPGSKYIFNISNNVDRKSEHDSVTNMSLKLIWVARQRLFPTTQNRSADNTTKTFYCVNERLSKREFSAYLPSAVILMSEISAGVPMKLPTAPAVIPIPAFMKKLGGFPSL